jgi:hypothetical protein
MPPFWVGIGIAVVLFVVLFAVLVVISLGPGPTARRAERRLALLSELLHVVVSRGRCRCRRCAGSR